MTRRPTLAVWKFASCDGCQLSLLDCEDDLLQVADAVDIAYFLEAGPSRVEAVYDVSLVEGSVTTPDDAERIRRVRAASRQLVTIGACATSGGIQALRNGVDVDGFLDVVYATPAFVRTLATSTPIAEYVPVDVELRGCPIDRGQLLEVIGALLHGRRPRLPASSVCIECKRRGTPCVLVTGRAPCLGPITHDGCGAICPGFQRGCYGCFGPMESPNVAALSARLGEDGVSSAEIGRLLRTFNVGAEAFRAGAAQLDAEGAGPGREGDGR